MITRSEAIASGSAFYFTGRPCKRGHVSRRRVSGCSCVECESVYSESAATYKKNWYLENRERIIEKSRIAYEKDGKAKRAYALEYQKKHLPRIVAARANRQKADPVYAAKERVRALIKQCLKTSGTEKTSRTSQILGCTTKQFKEHLERQFLPTMGWHNFSEWHIDHIVPVSSAKTEEEVIALNHFTNLRPLWASENLRKSNRMEFLI